MKSDKTHYLKKRELRPQKEKLDNLCWKKERKIKIALVLERCHLYCIIPKLLDTSDTENWKNEDSHSFLILRNTFKSSLSIWNEIFNFTQVAIEAILQYFFLRMQNEKRYPRNSATSVIRYWEPLLISHLCIGYLRLTGGEGWLFETESKFCQILKSAEESFDINPSLLWQILQGEDWTGNQHSPICPLLPGSLRGVTFLPVRAEGWPCSVEFSLVCDQIRGWGERERQCSDCFIKLNLCIF